MEESQNVGIASVSYPHKQPQTTITAQEDYDTDSILSLVSKLYFKVDEQNKEQFFKELESVLFDELQKDETEQNYSDLINFFLKHISLDGKISA